MKNRRTRNLCISRRRQLQGLVARPSLAELKLRSESLKGLRFSLPGNFGFLNLRGYVTVGSFLSTWEYPPYARIAGLSAQAAA